jgi:hypothetical protein
MAAVIVLDDHSDAIVAFLLPRVHRGHGEADKLALL